MAKTRSENIENINEEINNEIIEKEEVKIEKKPLDERAEKRRLENQRRREVREKIKKDTEIIVMNNCSNGSFFYKNPQTGLIIEFDKFAQEQYITYEELDMLQRRHRGILEKYWIIPVDVVSSEVTIEEVLETLGLSGLYTGDMFYSDNLDYILLKTKKSDFRNIVNECNPKYAESLAERAVALYNEEKFTDVFRMEIISEKIGKKDLFKDLMDSREDE